MVIALRNVGLNVSMEKSVATGNTSL